MGRFKRIFFKFYYKLRPQNAVKLARKIGVRFTTEPGKEKCRILSNPMDVFGSEPYLITIGEGVEITNGVRFIPHDGAVWALRNFDPKYKKLDIFGPIKVGNNVFFGNCVIVLPGVTIGDNVIIGAGSIVTKDIPSNSVAAGSPAKVIRSLEEYGERTVAKKGSMNTNGLSFKRKKLEIHKAFPEWFD